MWNCCRGSICKTLQHTDTRCKTQQYTDTRCNWRSDLAKTSCSAAPQIVCLSYLCVSRASFMCVAYLVSCAHLGMKKNKKSATHSSTLTLAAIFVVFLRRNMFNCTSHVPCLIYVCCVSHSWSHLSRFMCAPQYKTEKICNTQQRETDSNTHTKGYPKKERAQHRFTRHWHVSCSCVSPHLSHACVSLVSFMRVTCLIRLQHVTFIIWKERKKERISLTSASNWVCHISLWCVMQSVHVCDMSHARVYYGSFVRVMWQALSIWGGSERWGAGVETHFQEISWNLRPVVNGT